MSNPEPKGVDAGVAEPIGFMRHADIPIRAETRTSAWVNYERNAYYDVPVYAHPTYAPSSAIEGELDPKALETAAIDAAWTAFFKENERIMQGLHSALAMIAHTETEDSFGGSKDMPSDWYRQQARDALAEYETALAPPTPYAERAGEPTRQAIWDAVDRLIESAPVDGKAADGEYNEHVQTSQRSFIDGLRRARLCVLNLYAPQSPATEAVTEAMVERAKDAYGKAMVASGYSGVVDPKWMLTALEAAALLSTPNKEPQP